jgi:hypothetical protein
MDKFAELTADMVDGTFRRLARRIVEEPARSLGNACQVAPKNNDEDQNSSNPGHILVSECLCQFSHGVARPFAL